MMTLGSGSVFRFWAGSVKTEYGSETLFTTMIDLLLYLDGLGVGLVRGDDLKELHLVHG